MNIFADVTPLWSYDIVETWRISFAILLMGKFCLGWALACQVWRLNQ